MPFGRKRNETGNQFEGLLGQGERLNNEVAMADLMVDMDTSVKKHSRRGLGNQSSQEYQNVQSTLSNVVFTTNGNFTNDVAANEKMMTQAMGNYYKLLAACEAYLAKPGGFSMSGRARKSKVIEIQKYAQRDIMGIEQAYHAMKSMNGEQQSTLTWTEILHSARMDIIEVADYSDEKLNLGGNAKTGEYVGKKLNEGIFSPNLKVAHAHSSLTSSSLYDKDNVEANNAVAKVETNMANRNVATSRVANLFGLGSIVEQSTNVKVKDKKSGDIREGSLMTLAKGRAARDRNKKDLHPQMLKLTSVEEREKLAKSKISPTLQKELSSLQVLDYICGQGDRHQDNFFTEVDSKGRYTHVHGIDNDNSFSTGVETENVARRDGGVLNQQRFLRMVVDSKDNLTIPHMDKQLAQNILQIKEDELRFVLKDLLEEPFIDAALKRLHKLKTAIKKELDKGTDSKVFMEENDWGNDSLEDFLNFSLRRKVIEKLQSEKLFGPEAKKLDLHSKMNMDELIEITKGDNYISSLVNEMVGFNEKYYNYEMG